MKTSEKRRITQAITLVACNLGFLGFAKVGLVAPFMFCHGCPLATLACPLGAIQHFLSLGRPPILAVAISGILYVFLGRLACGWLCPSAPFRER